MGPNQTTPPRPSAFAQLRTAALWGCGSAILLIPLALLLVLSGSVVLPRGMIISAILLMILLGNLFWWAWNDRRLSNETSGGENRKRRRVWRIIWAAYIALMVLLFPLRFLGIRRIWEVMPTPAVSWLLVWNLTIAVAAPLLGIGALIILLNNWRRRRTDAPPAEASLQTVATPPASGTSRRALLQAAVGAAPLLITGGATIVSAGQSGSFRVRRLNLKLPKLPDRLRGLTITHVSDMHVGRLFRPEHLPAMVDACNRLNSDLLMITGDIVDHDIDFLPPALDAIQSLESRYGRYIVPGNHDLIDQPKNFIAEITRRETGYLSDRRVALDIGGETLQIAGLFWSSEDEPTPFDPGHGARADRALQGSDPDAFTIALAHHPHAFDALAERNVDLTLAGHTHAGQLMLTPPSSSLRLGAGSVMFRYIYDVYRRQDSAMYVNAGVGNWFPLRVNAPAELVQIRLV